MEGSYVMRKDAKRITADSNACGHIFPIDPKTGIAPLSQRSKNPNPIVFLPNSRVVEYILRTFTSDLVAAPV